jgi:predicted dehydrogenase
MRLANNAGGTGFAAVCDVYGPNRSKARTELAPGADELVDYRKLLERKDIDAVIIGSPDHWHVQMTLDAIDAGKDVYVEKPVTHAIEEGHRLLEGVRKSDRVVQTGTQQRSWPHFVEARELIQGGELGKITLIKTFWYQSYLKRGDTSAREVNLDQLDWNRWLGSAPKQPFNADRFFNWRWFWDFGGGAMTDLFVHWVDVVHWVMGSEEPEVVQGMGDTHILDDLECPDTLNATLRYPGRFSVTYTGSMIGFLEGGGLIFRGTEGMMRLHRSGYRIYREHPSYSENPENDKVSRQVDSKRDGGIDHMANFLECIRSRREPNAPVASGIKSAAAGHLGNLAIRSEKTIRAKDVLARTADRSGFA